jgi:hypothetical protein
MVFAGLAVLELARQLKIWRGRQSLIDPVSDKVQT